MIVSSYIHLLSVSCLSSCCSSSLSGIEVQEDNVVSWDDAKTILRCGDVNSVAGAPSLDDGKGMVVVRFENASAGGGETANLSTASDASLATNLSGTWVLSSNLLGGAPPTLTFMNVTKGTTSVTVGGAATINACTLVYPEIGNWPVLAKTMTHVNAMCSPL